MIEFGPPPKGYKESQQLKTKGWSFAPESMSALLARPEPQISWLIESIWVDKARGLIAGNPGIGKTWLALDMLLSVASGSLCLGRYNVQQGPTLLVEEESSVSNLARRIHSMARAREFQASIPFHHITRQFLKIQKHEAELKAFIKHEGIKLVVFDSLRRFHTVDENSSEKMQPVLDAFGRINSETGASVVLIHHLAKQGDKESRKPIFEKVRGTSDLWAWRDCILGLEGETDSTTSNCSFQFRDAESPKPIRIKRTVDAISGAISMAAIGIEESDEFDEKSGSLLDYVRKHQPVTKDQTCAKAGGRRADNIRIFNVLTERGLLVKQGFKWGVPNVSGTGGNGGNG